MPISASRQRAPERAVAAPAAAARRHPREGGGTGWGCSDRSPQPLAAPVCELPAICTCHRAHAEARGQHVAVYGVADER